jgi:hypothetical protein
MPQDFWPAQPALGFTAANDLFSFEADRGLGVGPDLEVDPDWEAAPGPVSGPVSCPAAAVDHHRPDWAAGVDSDARAVGSPAAGVAGEAAVDVAEGWGAPPAAWAAAVAGAADAAAAADASNNRGAHTKAGPHSSDPNNRRD